MDSQGLVQDLCNSCGWPISITNEQKEAKSKSFSAEKEYNVSELLALVETF